MPTPPSPIPPFLALTRQRCIYAGQEDRRELGITHAQRIQLKHVVLKHVNERAVVLLLLVLFQLLHGKFRTCRIVTFIHFSHRNGANKAFSFFCAGEYTDANDAKVERIESRGVLGENCYIWKQYLAEIDKKRKTAEVSHTQNRRMYRKSSNKAFSASRAKFRMQIPGCERVT